MRKGTLSDAETLRLYEQGLSLIAICVKEGMTPHGVISRIARARRERRGGLSAMRGGRATRAARQPTLDSFAALRRAVNDLERQTRPQRHLSIVS